MFICIFDKSCPDISKSSEIIFTSSSIEFTVTVVFRESSSDPLRNLNFAIFHSLIWRRLDLHQLSRGIAFTARRVFSIPITSPVKLVALIQYLPDGTRTRDLPITRDSTS